MLLSLQRNCRQLLVPCRCSWRVCEREQRFRKSHMDLQAGQADHADICWARQSWSMPGAATDGAVLDSISAQLIFCELVADAQHECNKANHCTRRGRYYCVDAK
jgi:hypothetical protein